MIGKTYPSEKHNYYDKKTGRLITQLTAGEWNNYHLYFTDNSFTVGDRDIYFYSDRGSKQKKVYNMFRMDLETGVMTQLTDEPSGINYATKSPDSEWVVYTVGKFLKKLNTRTLETDIIYEEKGPIRLGSPFISPDKKYVGLCRNEDVQVELGANYLGFNETMFAVKKGWITLVYLDEHKVVDVHQDTHWLGHFQFAPDDSGLATFCHEGPWHLVHQRMWLLDITARDVKPCFRQGEDDCVGHEFWTRDGRIFFDNRRKGHDGTITSSKTQAVIDAKTSHDPDQMPYIGLANKRGDIERIIDMPFYCNHYHANNENTILVGDEVEDLVLIDLRPTQAKLHTLCEHHTSWHTQSTHCHPTFSWKADRILFASDRDGTIQLYIVEVPELG